MNEPILGGTPEWRSHFDAQLTPALVKQLAAFTTRVENRFSNRLGRGRAEDRVHSAVVKTLDGTLRWNPDRGGLARHLMRAIESSMSADLRRTRRFPHASIDDDSEDLDALDGQITRRLQAERESAEEAIERSWTDLIESVRPHVGTHGDLRALVQAYELGARSKHSAMRTTGLSDLEYRAAHQRLTRIARRLVHSTRSSVGAVCAPGIGDRI